LRRISRLAEELLASERRIQRRALLVRYDKVLRNGPVPVNLLQPTGYVMHKEWVRIPPGAWMSVCCECFVLSSRGLCDELTTRPEDSYRLWCVAVCYRNLVNEEPNINRD
jgi:hypothetical protein